MLWQLTEVPACRYGVYVLIVEILGAISTLLYGVNLLWDPVNPPAEADPNNPELPQVCQLWVPQPACSTQHTGSLLTSSWLLQACTHVSSLVTVLPAAFQHLSTASTSTGSAGLRHGCLAQ